jgi:hypothetical protein
MLNESIDAMNAQSPQDLRKDSGCEHFRPVSNFGFALSLLKEGERMARSGWNGKGMWIALQAPDQHSKMSLPYIFMHTVQGQRVPWLASQTDLLAEDWYRV